MPPKIPLSLKDQVRVRANFLCEYCHTAEQWQLTEFTIDHVVPVALGGTNDAGNLALACFHCNRRKSNKILMVLEDNVAEVPLFDPRMMRWQDHFVWSSDLVYIVPLTDVGRATVNCWI